MPVLDVQRRGQQIGRIRIGEQVQAANGRMRPSKLETFRFTTGSRATAEAIAALYGGEIRDWLRGQFEVITEKSEIGVTVPPRDQVVSQWYELWSKGGCQRRCDSQTMSDGKPCLCPHSGDPDDEVKVTAAAAERARMASLNPPQACKLVTRISVMLPDLPGLGVFRLDTGSFYAATEIGDTARLLQMARDQGVFLPAVLRIEQRQRVANGTTKNYPVPVLEVLATFRDIATGALGAGGMAAQLPPPPGGAPKALTAGTPDLPGPAPLKPDGVGPGGAGEVPPADSMRAEDIANLAMTVAASREDVEALTKTAEANGCMDDLVCTDAETDVYEELREYLRDRWKQLPETRQVAG